jgi:hypothetical protein
MLMTPEKYGCIPVRVLHLPIQYDCPLKESDVLGHQTMELTSRAGHARHHNILCVVLAVQLALT